MAKLRPTPKKAAVRRLGAAWPAAKVANAKKAAAKQAASTRAAAKRAAARQKPAAGPRSRPGGEAEDLETPRRPSRRSRTKIAELPVKCRYAGGQVWLERTQLAGTGPADLVLSTRAWRAANIMPC